MFHTIALSLLLLVFAVAPGHAQERMCSAREFAATVDETATALRNLNSDSEKRFQEKLQALARQQNWNEQERNQRASNVMNDSRLESFNSEIETLVTQIDSLSSSSGGPVSCERLNDLKKARDRLLTVMGQKSGYMLAELDQSGRSAALARPATATDGAAPARAGESRTEPAASQPKPSVADKPAEPAKTAKAEPGDPSSFESRMRETLQKSPGEQQPWSAGLSRNEGRPGETAAAAQDSGRDYLPTQSLQPPSSQGGGSNPQERDYAALPPPADQPGAEVSPSAIGYTIQEIRDAGKGVFGTLSAELAGVINYAFQNYGRPNGYIIGDEGGGAFLAGLRYGSGRLHLKLGGQEIQPAPIYWQGPSLGWDFGATGSRTLFLVYNLTEPGKLLRRFTGVDGSAYVVGGVGLTVLSAKDIVIVPIRTGLGLRIGANIGYVKFSDRATWNPF